MSPGPSGPPAASAATRPAALAALAVAMLAANSVLTRAGVLAGTDPMAFAAIRVGAGALVLALLARGRIPLGGRRRWGAAVALATYLAGFSLAYRTLDAGLGALILFGTVQVALLAAGVALGERPAPHRWLGMGTALAGLAWLLWPDEAAGRPLDLALMVVAGLGWAAYSFAGKGEPAPVIPATAANFLLAAGMIALAAPWWWGASLTGSGALLAALSGGVTSGLGYALLYRVLPRVGVAAAGALQLAVPPVAVLGGVIALGEAATARMVLAGALTLAGVALASRPARGAKAD